MWPANNYIPKRGGGRGKKRVSEREIEGVRKEREREGGWRKREREGGKEREWVKGRERRGRPSSSYLKVSTFPAPQYANIHTTSPRKALGTRVICSIKL